jgi:hypothetical protein
MVLIRYLTHFDSLILMGIKTYNEMVYFKDFGPKGRLEVLKTIFLILQVENKVRNKVKISCLHQVMTFS